MEFETLIRNFYQIKINQNHAGDLLEEMLRIIQDFNFTKEHEVFYPEGIFLDEILALHFFCEDYIYTVSIIEKDTKIITRKYEEISSIEYGIPDRFNRSILIKFKNGTDINLNNAIDTNSNWTSRFKDKITDIYKYLLLKK